MLIDSLPGHGTLTLTLPGAFPIVAGAYVEIDTFRNTVHTHLAGGGTDNTKSCIDVASSDFFPLVPGSNDLFLVWSGTPGVKAEVVYRNAWV